MKKLTLLAVLTVLSNITMAEVCRTYCTDHGPGFGQTCETRCTPY